jgi:hypothetical protein
MIKYTGAAAVVAAAYGINGAIELTAILFTLNMCMFYFVITKIFIGLSQSLLSKDVDILYMTMIYMIHFTMGVAVWMSEYSYLALIGAPWMFINGISCLMSALYKMEVIDIKNKED